MYTHFQHTFMFKQLEKWILHPMTPLILPLTVTRFTKKRPLSLYCFKYNWVPAKPHADLEQTLQSIFYLPLFTSSNFIKNIKSLSQFNENASFGSNYNDNVGYARNCDSVTGEGPPEGTAERKMPQGLYSCWQPIKFVTLWHADVSRIYTLYVHHDFFRSLFNDH